MQGPGKRVNARITGLLSQVCQLSVPAILTQITSIVMQYIDSAMVGRAEVQTLAVQVLRIELLAEPLFAVSIVASGALRGAEDTLVPSILNLLSIWVVRIGLSLLLVGKFGLHGVWIAMAVELCVRGLLMLGRLRTSKYFKTGS